MLALMKVRHKLDFSGGLWSRVVHWRHDDHVAVLVSVTPGLAIVVMKTNDVHGIAASNGHNGRLAKSRIAPLH